MLIVGQRILDDGLLEDASPAHIRSASYYLRVHSIIPAGEEARTFDVAKPKKNHVIQPGGLAWIVSKESFSIKNCGITALVTLRSTFTKQGLLALDVGLVDAKYEGPIGSVVINFSKNDLFTKEGEEFFRVMFFEHEVLPEHQQFKGAKFSHEEYSKERLANLVTGFPSTFLQTKEIEERIKSTIIDKKIIEELQSDLINKVLFSVVKTYWLKGIGIILVTSSMIFLFAFWFVNAFLTPLTVDGVREYINQQLEAQIPRRE